MFDPNDPREIMAAALLKRGSATMRELLTMAYGEWPLKGLDINPDVPHSQVVTLVANPDMDDLGSTDSYARRTQINDRLCREGDGIASTIGHEALHVLQGDNYYVAHAKEVYGEKELSKILPGPLLRSRASTLEMAKMTAVDDWEKEVMAPFNGAAEDSDNMNYLKGGTEMQARLHQTLMAGYQVWHKMPGNIEELWAGLSAYGLTPPPSVEAQLDSLPENSSAQDFMKGGGEHPAITRELQRVNQNLTPSSRETLWRETLPMLYADLIEMFGDRKGRERFGLGVNIKAQAQKEVFSDKPSTASPITKP